MKKPTTKPSSETVAAQQRAATRRVSLASLSAMDYLGHQVTGFRMVNPDDPTEGTVVSLDAEESAKVTELVKALLKARVQPVKPEG